MHTSRKKVFKSAQGLKTQQIRIHPEINLTHVNNKIDLNETNLANLNCLLGYNCPLQLIKTILAIKYGKKYVNLRANNIFWKNGHYLKDLLNC